MGNGLEDKRAMTEHLDALRKRVSQCNADILNLLNQRAAIALEIMEEKKRRGLPLFDSHRQQAMLDELTATNRGPYTREMVCDLFREIFRATRKCMGERSP